MKLSGISTEQVRALLVISMVVLVSVVIIRLQMTDQPQGAYYTSNPPNFLAEMGYSDVEIAERIDDTWDQMFYGTDNERLYYPAGDNMAYILNVADDDVRTEGLAYGMMIAVQLGHQREFDRLWRWANEHLRNDEDSRYAGYFAWQAQPNGTRLDDTPAPDAEQWFALSLMFASAKWGDGEGLFNYSAQAKQLLAAMNGTDGNPQREVAMFHPLHQMVVFVPTPPLEETFTNPSYHLPHFYQVWAGWTADENPSVYWQSTAEASRQFWRQTTHPQTGLAPNYAEFDGTPRTDVYGGVFSADAWRVGINIAMDYTWFEPSTWHVEQSNRWLDFFHEQGMYNYASRYQLNGEPVPPSNQAVGLIAANAAVASISDHPSREDFIRRFWETPIPEGHWRYYDGMLYMIVLLHLSGNFDIYTAR